MGILERLKFYFLSQLQKHARVGVMEKDEIVKEIVKVIRQYLPPDYKVLLFGSWAKGTALDVSDLDIGLDGPGKIDQEIMIKIKAGLEGILTLRSIDLVDLNSAGGEFKKDILKHAQILNP